MFEFDVISSDDSNDTPLNYSVVFLEWTTTDLSFNLGFKDPLLVSEDTIPDRLVIKIIRPEVFKSITSEETLQLSSEF